jgi:hypothetical protein
LYPFAHSFASARPSPPLAPVIKTFICSPSFRRIEYRKGVR